MNTNDIIYVDLQGHVIAFSKHDGTQLWKADLKSGFQAYDASFVTVLAEGERVYAHFYGHFFCLNASTGERLWTVEVGGRGYDVAMLAVVGASSPSLAAVLQEERRRAADGGAGMTGA